MARAEGAWQAVRCSACGERFVADPGGPGVCPRCGAIGAHEWLGADGP